MASITNTNGLRAVTGGQAGTMDMQFVLISCPNAAFTLTPTQTVPSNNYEFISNANDGLAQIIAVVQDFAEIYYIGWPQADAGDPDITAVTIAVNPVSARGLPETIDFYPTATGRWTDLETALNDAIAGGSAEAWFAMPGGTSDGWSFSYDN